MNLNEYQNKAMEFAAFERDSYPFFALAEEVGEVLGIVAKGERGDDLVARYGTKENLQAALLKEMGDVLWQLTACIVLTGSTLEEVAQMNLNKLTDRKARNVIKGAGDNR